MIEDFGRMPDGTVVEKLTLRGGGLTASFLTYGAILQDLRLQGHGPSLVLGFPEFPNYLTKSPYFGATAGRCINRIKDGKATIAGKDYQLDTNFLGKHTLHGGREGIGKSIWTVKSLEPNTATLTIRAKDGHMGFPGNLDIELILSVLDGGTLDLVMTAQTDATTLCNLGHHSYFNLSDEPTVLDHLMQIDGYAYLPVTEELIPTGEIRPVAGTAFDYTLARPVSNASPIDHNWCLATEAQPMRDVCHVVSPKSGVRMDVATTEPGLQVYDAPRVDIDVPGLDGRVMAPHCGLALEPQIWPDAVNNPEFPQAFLNPGETYRQHTQFRFSKP